MTARDELLDQFLIEGRELSERANGALARLATSPADRDAVDALFRAVHTLKGAVGLFDLPAWGRVLHLLEGRLETARDGAGVSGELAAVVSRTLDLSDLWLDELEAGRATADLARAADGLAAELGGPAATPRAGDPSGFSSAGPPPDWALALGGDAGVSTPFVAVRYTPAPEAYFQGEDPLGLARALPGLVRLVLEAAPVEGDGVAYDPFRCTLSFSAVCTAALQDVQAAFRLATGKVDTAVVAQVGPDLAQAPNLRSLRVDADRLDELAALVDELVIAKNALAHQAADLVEAATRMGRGRAFADAQAAVERVVSNVHVAVTRMRLVALRPLLSRFPRQAREIAASLGKEVQLVISGEQVAVDKSIVEGLFEPLLHLVRNAIDHGIEPAAVRRELGKPSVARLSISASVLGDEVAVEVADDGRGVDVAKVRRTAVDRGLVDAATAASLTDTEAAELIFAPGFSTAGQVSELSGRGVGMDAVRAAVSRLGGRTSLDNRPGQGLCVRLTIPAQVVLTKVLVVKAGGQRFGVPLDCVSETHRVERDQVTAIRAGRAYVRQADVIPLVRLSELLGVAPATDPKVFPVIAVEAASGRIGVQIDELAEPVEAPLRPMSGLLAGYPGMLGTVLQGDGQVLLVLDLAELAA